MDGDEAVSLGVGGAFSRKRKPPSDSTLGAGIAPALWGFASPESTYRASMGAPPQRIEQRTHESEPPTEGRGGQSTLEACAQPLAVEFLLLLFFAQTKEKKGTPQRAKGSPPEVSTSGGLLPI